MATGEDPPTLVRESLDNKIIKDKTGSYLYDQQLQ